MRRKFAFFAFAFIVLCSTVSCATLSEPPVKLSVFDVHPEGDKIVGKVNNATDNYIAEFIICYEFSTEDGVIVGRDCAHVYNLMPHETYLFKAYSPSYNGKLVYKELGSAIQR